MSTLAVLSNPHAPPALSRGRSFLYRSWLSEAAARRLSRVLTTDPGMGIVRHVDAGYDEAAVCARRHGVSIPSLR